MAIVFMSSLENNSWLEFLLSRTCQQYTMKKEVRSSSFRQLSCLLKFVLVHEEKVHTAQEAHNVNRFLQNSFPACDS